jgi:hypothetical protein
MASSVAKCKYIKRKKTEEIGQRGLVKPSQWLIDIGKIPCFKQQDKLGFTWRAKLG